MSASRRARIHDAIEDATPWHGSVTIPVETAYWALQGLASATTMLRRLEWAAASDGAGHGQCVICYQFERPGEGHAPDCELAELLRRIG